MSRASAAPGPGMCGMIKPPAWVTNTFGACSLPCGVGEQSRGMLCFSFERQAPAHSSECLVSAPQPPATKSCNVQVGARSLKIAKKCRD